jgi:hypothetical protein
VRAARAIDQVLGGDFSACMVHPAHNQVFVTWPMRVGYDVDDVYRAIERAAARGTLAA